LRKISPNILKKSVKK